MAMRRWSERPTIRLLGAGIGTVAAAAVSLGFIWWCLNGWFAGDTLTYWLAGTRILVGHDLYAVRPDDLWLPPLDIRPFGLLSPPLLALPWIGLAAMPGTSGMLLWWLAMALAVAWALGVVLLGTRGWAGALVLPLVPSIVLLAGVGNVDAVVLAGVIGAWMLVSAGRLTAAGVVVAVLVSVKLTPAVLIVWLAATRRWRALGIALAVAVLLLAAVALVLGPAILVDYVGVVTRASGAGRTWALAVVATGLVAVVALGRHHERASFALAIALIPLGSPVAAIHSWAMLVGCATPWIRER